MGYGSGLSSWTDGGENGRVKFVRRDGGAGRENELLLSKVGWRVIGGGWLKEAVLPCRIGPNASGVFWRMGGSAVWFRYIAPGGGVGLPATGIPGPKGGRGPGESVLDIGEKALIAPGGGVGAPTIPGPGS